MNGLENSTWFIVAVSALLGALVGSFSNVLIYRIPRGQSISFPPSRCPNCGHRLGVLDLVPVFSWVALGGKCRYCGAPISSRYPLVETVSALGYGLLALAFPLEKVGIGLLGLFALYTALLVGSAVDLERKELPDPITLGFLPLGLFFALLNDRTGASSLSTLPSFMGALEGAALGAGTLALLGAYGSWLTRRFAEPRPIYPLGWMQMTLAALVAVLLALFSVPYAALWGLGAALLSSGINFVLKRPVHYPDFVTLLGTLALLLIGWILAANGQLKLSVLGVLSSGTMAAGGTALLVGYYWWFAPEPAQEDPEDTYSSDYGAMGYGDVKLMGMVGAFIGWTATGMGMILAIFLGAVLGIALYLRTKDRQVPFGPFLALGALIALFYQAPLLEFLGSIFKF